MNPMDILGTLLGHKTSGGGRGGDVLTDIFGRKSQPPRQSSGRSSGARPTSIDEQAKELEDLLNVANDRRVPAPSSTSRSTPAPRSSTDIDERAMLLVRAMVGAAKADGKLDDKEQQAIIKQLKNPTRDDINFLQQEFARPVDVDEFARSVPVGMEQQVYSMSLIAIDLDTGDEAKYLMKLADGLRLTADVRESIHARMGAPSIY